MCIGYQRTMRRAGARRPRPVRRSAAVRPLPRAVPAPARRRLLRGVRLARAAASRSDRIGRPASRRGLPRTGVRPVGRRGLRAASDPALDPAGRRAAHGAVLARDRAVRGRAGRHRADRRLRGAVGPVPVARGGRSGLPALPVGPAAAGDRRAGRALCAAGLVASAGDPASSGRGGALAGLEPGVQADLPVRGHQAAERRRDVAEPDRAPPPLRDAAPSDPAGLVRAQRPGLVRRRLGRGDVLRRARRAVRRFRAPSLPGRPDGRLRAALPAAGADRGHRQLRLLQPADGGALRLPARRRGRRPRAAAAAGDARRRAAPCAPAAGAARGRGGGGHDRGGAERADVRAGDAPPGADAGLVRGAARGGGPAAFGQRLRPVPRDDDRTAGDRRRRFRRRRDLDRVPVPLEGGRPRTGARLRAAAHAASRLADVVRGARPATPRPLAVRPRRRPARERSGRARPAGRQSLPRRAAPLRPPGALPLPVHDARGRDRRGLVGARADRLPHRAPRRAPPTRNFWRPAISASACRAWPAVSGCGSASSAATRCW